MSVLTHLSDLAGGAFEALGLPASLGQVVPSQRPELAQYQCNGAMEGAKQAGRSPREIATEVAEALSQHVDIESTDVAGPGFINLNLTPRALADWAERSAADDHLGYAVSDRPKRVLVDYAGPNVAKAMHVGHLRATIIGDSLARLFAFAGHHVIRDPHFGDWGFQMGLLIATVDEQGIDPASITLEDLQRIYPEASQRAQDDPTFADLARSTTVALQQGDEHARTVWKHMKAVSEASQRTDFSALGVEFDLWYGESDVADQLQPLVERLEKAGVTEISDGALIVRVDQPDDNREWPPLIVKSSAGGFLYSTTDVATVEHRIDDLEVDLMLYVVDHRQGDHFTQVFRTARRAGIAGPDVEMEHIGFGTMNGPDGKPFKTREGGVVRLADVIAMVTAAARDRIDEAQLAENLPAEERELIASQVGVAALKYGDLVNNRSSDYKFDLERFSSFDGKTGPFLQYAAVRIKSILRRAAEQGLRPGEIIPPRVEAEVGLFLAIFQVPAVIQRSLDLREPNHIAEYAFELARQWNRFYEECHILTEPDAKQQASWLAVAGWAESALETLLGLLGIEVPDRM